MRASGAAKRRIANDLKATIFDPHVKRIDIVMPRMCFLRLLASGGRNDDGRVDWQ
jgi:hypothetical protein